MSFNKYECPGCGVEISSELKFCSNCGENLSNKDVQKNKDEQESQEEIKKDDNDVNVKVDSEIEGSSVNSVDLSIVDPETWECYGQIEPNHVECRDCQFKEGCSKKSKGLK